MQSGLNIEVVSQGKAAGGIAGRLSEHGYYKVDNLD